MNYSESDSKKQALFKKILGCLAMVAIGDALGMPAHDMTSDKIKERFGGSIRGFAPPPSKTAAFTKACGPGRPPTIQD